MPMAPFLDRQLRDDVQFFRFGSCDCVRSRTAPQSLLVSAEHLSVVPGSAHADHLRNEISRTGLKGEAWASSNYTVETSSR
jgi:hypothetical protein